MRSKDEIRVGERKRRWKARLISGKAVYEYVQTIPTLLLSS